MRRVPRNYPTTPLLHSGNASLGRNCTIEVGVARPECSADMECDAFLETGIHRCRILDRLICEGGISGMHRHLEMRHVPCSCDELPGRTWRPEKGEVAHSERVTHLGVHPDQGGALGVQR
jgi:hypothetical protein